MKECQANEIRNFPAKEGLDAPKMPRASIVIVTKNRKDELRRALQSSVAQEGDFEIVVIDDGSADGTSEMVREEFPGVFLQRHHYSAGCIVRRNQAAIVAKSPVIISIDDDAEFSNPSIVSSILKHLDHPDIAAVAIPYIDVHIDQIVQQSAPESTNIWIAAEYRGTAYAIKRNDFIKYHMYRERLMHQGEEGDLCIRMLEARRFVRLGSGFPIMHYASSIRSFARVHYYGQRNLVLFAWYNVPAVALPLHWICTIAMGLRWGLRHGGGIARLAGTAAGLYMVVSEWQARKPVSWRTYRLYRKLRKQGPTLLGDVVVDRGSSKDTGGSTM